MKKVILVIDMPENCCECPIYTGYSCHVHGPQPCKKKPKWCPLVEVPDKMDGLKAAATIEGCNHPAIYAQGFNNCIDKIVNRKAR